MKVRILQQRDIGVCKITNIHELITILQIDNTFWLHVYKVNHVGVDGQLTDLTLTNEIECESEDEAEYHIQGLI